MADVNYVVLEASKEAGMDAAAAKFAELLKTFPKDAAATIPPRLRVFDSVKDKWVKIGPSARDLADYSGLDRGVAEIARSFKGKLPPSPAEIPFLWTALAHMYGGWMGGYGEVPPEGSGMDVTSDGQMRAIAAAYLNSCRALGGRAFLGRAHYSAIGPIVALRAIFQSGLLNEQEMNEFESALALSIADPNDYMYEYIAKPEGGVWSDRHSCAVLLASLHSLDYVRNHCRMDDKTRQEIERRAAGASKMTAWYAGSYRDNKDTAELGETTLMQLYAMLHEGILDNIRGGALKLSADLYMMNTDNILDRRNIPGCSVLLSNSC